jgi:t-SNARE complex subunit (syntaxin)
MTGATHDQLNRALGRVEGSQVAMEKRLDTLEKTVTDGFEKVGDGLDRIDRRLAQIEAKEAERKGAWKVITAIAAAVAAVVASAVKYLMG